MRDRLVARRPRTLERVTLGLLGLLPRAEGADPPLLPCSVADQVAERLAAGCLLEWRDHSSGLLAVDAADEAMTHTVATALRPYEKAEQLNFETDWR